MTHEELIENADYVLGMADLYQKDGEIVKMLQMKGLSNSDVTMVLDYVKSHFYQKRLRQSKVQLRVAALTLLLLGGIPVFCLYLVSTGIDSVLLRMTGALIAFRIIQILLIAAIVSIFLNLFLLAKYKAKLSRVVN